MWNTLKNHVILFLVKRTYLYMPIYYAVMSKLPSAVLKELVQQIEDAREPH